MVKAELQKCSSKVRGRPTPDLSPSRVEKSFLFGVDFAGPH